MGWGGQEIRVVREAVGMTGRGHCLIIAARPGSVIFRKAQEAGIRTIPAGFIKKNPFSILKLRSIIDAEKPDILNTHSSPDSWVASLAAKLSRTRPKIIRTRHLSTHINSTIVNRFIYGTVPDAVLTTGEEIRNMLIHEKLCDGSRTFSVPTGVDTVMFDPAKTGPSISRKGISIGMVGVLRSWKGHKFLLEAVPRILEKIPTAGFYIAGDGPQREHIESEIRALGLQQYVIMLGHREDMPEVFASLDIVVHPSFANEGVPQTVLQAFAMGKAVVASNVGAIPEVVIDEKTGLLIGPRRPDLIAQAVIRLCNDESLRSGLGREARRLVLDKYSFEHMLDRVASVYERISGNERIQ